MNDIVKEGYVARKQGNEDVELSCFYRWCENQKVSSIENGSAIKWEILLSELKWNNYHKIEKAQKTK